MLTRRAVLAGTAVLAAPAVRAQNLEPVSIGLLRLASSGAVFIAQEKGYFREAGLQVELKPFTAAQQVPTAVTAGDADFGVTGLTAGFYNLAGRGALRIIAGQSREAPGFQLNAYMVTHAAYDAGFRTLRDFPGKRVAITTAGSTFHYSLGILARKYNFDIARVTMVQLQTLPNMAAAFKGGQVEAVLAPVTLARQLESENAGRILGWVGDETPWQLGALFTSPAMITNRRATAERFLRGYLRGCADYNRAFNQRNAQGGEVQGEGYADLIAILSRVLSQPANLVAVGLPFVDPQGRLDVQDIYDQVAFWQSANLARDVDARAIVDLSFIQGHINVPRG